MTLSDIERKNSISHLIGAVTGAFLLAALLIFKKLSLLSAVSYSVYGATFIFVFSMSAAYHGVSSLRAKRVLRFFDHISIYFFIAGTYTPILLLGLRGMYKWILLVVIWSLAALGVLFKLLAFGHFDRYEHLSLAFYLIMGWIALFILKPLYINNSPAVLIWLAAGGLLYSGGSYFYSKDGPEHPHYHLVWHFFILAAAMAQYVAVCRL